MPSQSLYLPRKMLIEKALQAARAKALTLIAAPMGYGKTTLAKSVAEALAEALEENVYYYSIPAGPHDAKFLWYDMFEHFESQGMEIVQAMHRLGFPESASQSRQAIEQLRTLAHPTYLILDDYHHVTDAAMSAFWEGVIKAEIPHMHIVLLSRTRPALNLEELRIKGHAAIFGQEVLAFTDDEAGEYFQMHGIDNAHAAAEAQKYSEGWPAALWLCLQSWLANGTILPSPDIESLLANTVFSSYDAEEQSFLMRLSVLEYFTAAEAERLSTTPHTPARLRTFRERNAFLSYDAKDGRYRFHGIFRDFLQKELSAASGIDKPSLYCTAAECCLERPDFINAFRFFAKAGRDEDRIRLLGLFLSPHYDKESVFFNEEVFRVTSEIPWRVRVQNPLGYLAFTAIFIALWNDTRTALLLDEAEEHFCTSPDVPEYMKKRLKGEGAVIRGLLAFNDMQAVCDYFAEACELLSGPSVILTRETAWNYDCPSASFLCLRESGSYAQLVALIENAWPFYSKLAEGAGEDGDAVCRAEYFLERGEFSQAEALLRSTILRCGSDKQLFTALSAAFSLARLHIASGYPEEALRSLENVRPNVVRIASFDAFECFDLAVGYINACLGYENAVPQWLRDGDVFDPPHDSAPQVAGFGLTVHGKVLLLTGGYQRLALVGANLPTCAPPLDCLFAHLHGKIFRAIAAWHTQGRDTALPLLREAVDLARPDALVLPLAEYGGHIVPLLRYYKRTVSKDAYVEKVLALAERIARVSSSPKSKKQKDLLTPREREFMRHVVGGMTNASIAKSLGVAEVTVRKALGQAYAKLGAANRAEASRRFMEHYGDSRSGVL